MRKYLTLLSTTFFLSVISSHSHVLAFTITANARISQFADFNSDTLTTNETVFSSLPLVSVSQNSVNGAVQTSASATPFSLTSSFSNSGSGISIPESNATFEDAVLTFQDNQALRDLIGPSNTSLDLLLNIDVSYELATEPVPGLFQQATSSVSVNLVANSLSGSFISGNASILNSSSNHSFSNSGFFFGLPENGGNVTATLPISIAPSSPDNLSVLFQASASVRGLALSNGFSNGQVSVNLPELNSFVTTTDGVPVSNLGIDFELLPQVDIDI